MRLQEPATVRELRAEGIRYIIPRGMKVVPLLAHSELVSVRYDGKEETVSLLSSGGSRQNSELSGENPPWAYEPLLRSGRKAPVSLHELALVKGGQRNLDSLYASREPLTPPLRNSLVERIQRGEDVSVYPELYRRLQPELVHPKLVKLVMGLGGVYVALVTALLLLLKRRLALFLAQGMLALVATCVFLLLPVKASLLIEVENTLLDKEILTVLRGVAGVRGRCVVEIASSLNLPRPLYYAPGDWETVPILDVIPSGKGGTIRMELWKNQRRAFEIWIVRRIGLISAERFPDATVRLRNKSRFTIAPTSAPDKPVLPGEETVLEEDSRLTCIIRTPLALSLRGFEHTTVRYIPTELPLSDRAESH